MRFLDRTSDWAHRHKTRRKWFRPRTQIDKAANGGIITILSLILFSIQLFQWLFSASKK